MNYNYNNFRMDNFIFNFINKLLMDLPVPNNVSYWWKFGSCLLLFMMMQILSGLFLAMKYMPDSELAFLSLDYMMRDLNKGWLIRSMHSNGASFYFFFLYLHLGRGLYYKSFFFINTWLSGLTILIISMAMAFLGYVLPWGKMSYWGAAVMTNLFSVIPYFGLDFVNWVWGGFSVVSSTLTRFFVLHFILPFIIVFLVFLHVMFLHQHGSKNPLGINSNKDKIFFYPFFLIKDLYGFMMVLLIYFFICLLHPYIFLCYEKFMEAKILSTPEHMEPDWFLLLPYAILRSMPKKLGGVLGLISTLVVFFFLPFMLNNNKRGNQYKIFIQSTYWWWLFVVLILSLMGASPVESPYMELGQLFGLFYFFYFFFLFFYFFF